METNCPCEETRKQTQTQTSGSLKMLFTVFQTCPRNGTTNFRKTPMANLNYL
jgi:hypothetical protein